MTTRRRQSAPVLDRLIVLHIPGPETVDDYGQRIPGPATDYRVWAKKSSPAPRDMQDLDNDQDLVLRVSTFTIRYREDVAARQLITDDMGLSRQIIGIVESEERRRYWHLLCEAIT